MKTIKIFCLHPSCKDVKSTFSFLHLEGQFDLDFEWSSSCPDFLIATEHIYTNKSINKTFKKIYRSAKIVVFFGGEAVSPDFNLFDYAVGFDGNLKNDDRFVQILPPYMMFRNFLPQDRNEIESKEDALKLLKQKSKFCNFLYSNWMAHPNRDKLFYILSKYKRVDSLGKHLNNVGVKGTGFSGHSMDCIKIKNPYKFSIACENASYLGYTSEKLLTSLAAHTVPIYWGDPEVSRNINPDCFIDCNKLDSLEDVLEIVKRIDEDDDLWATMVASPWRLENQLSYHDLRYKNYISFWKNLFYGDVNKLRRMPKGTFPEWKRRFFYKANAINQGKLFFLFEKIKFKINNRS